MPAGVAMNAGQALETIQAQLYAMGHTHEPDDYDELVRLVLFHLEPPPMKRVRWSALFDVDGVPGPWGLSPSGNIVEEELEDMALWVNERTPLLRMAPPVVGRAGRPSNT